LREKIWAADQIFEVSAGVFMPTVISETRNKIHLSVMQIPKTNGVNKKFCLVK
jgi:hypothetical protein